MLTPIDEPKYMFRSGHRLRFACGFGSPRKQEGKLQGQTNLLPCAVLWTEK